MAIAADQFLDIHPDFQQLGNLVYNSMAELYALQEAQGIIDYHEKFVVTSSKVTFPEPYLVSVYLADLQPDTLMNVRMFRPQLLRQCLMIGKLYEPVHSCKPNKAIEEFLQLPKHEFKVPVSEIKNVEPSTNLDESSTDPKDSTNKKDETCITVDEMPINIEEDAISCVRNPTMHNWKDPTNRKDAATTAFQEMPINLEEDVISWAGPAICASGITNIKENLSGEQSTMDLEVCVEAKPRSTCFSVDPFELPQPAVENNCVATNDEHLQQVISVPLANSMNMGYLVDSISMESMVDAIDCTLVGEVFEQTSQLNTNLLQVTTSDAPRCSIECQIEKLGYVVRNYVLQLFVLLCYRHQMITMEFESS